MKKYSKEDQKLMAIWSIDCAAHVLALFETVSPTDDRPRKALEIGREWVRTGVFKMAVIRAASLEAHAAAKAVKENDAACFAAHAAGQAVATAHVAQHAYGGAYYALKAVAAASERDTVQSVANEFEWQSQKLPEHLRQEIMSRLIINKSKSKPTITLRKGEGF